MESGRGGDLLTLLRIAQGLHSTNAPMKAFQPLPTNLDEIEQMEELIQAERERQARSSSEPSACPGSVAQEAGRQGSQREPPHPAEAAIEGDERLLQLLHGLARTGLGQHLRQSQDISLGRGLIARL